MEIELKFREELNYPPFCRLLLVRSEEKSEKKAKQEMDSFLEWVGSVDPDGKIGVLGPTTTFSSKQKKRVYQCQLKISGAIEGPFFDQLSGFLTEKSSHLWFDADPQS